MVNWKNRAKKWEQEALTANENLVKVAFCLEKEKALRRRSDEKNLNLGSLLERACSALAGAAENMQGAGRPASARELNNVLYDLRMGLMGRMQIASALTKDEHH